MCVSESVDVTIFGKTFFWDYAENLPECLPDGTADLSIYLSIYLS